MKKVYNPRKYYRYFLIWISAVVMCFLLSSAGVFLAGILEDKYVSIAIITIIFLPLLIIGIYGLIAKYSISGKWKHIYYGPISVIISIIWIVIYFFVVITSIFII
jgi:hypothetical protein